MRTLLNARELFNVALDAAFRDRRSPLAISSLFNSSDLLRFASRISYRRAADEIHYNYSLELG